jgi:hypothetical protein
VPWLINIGVWLGQKMLPWLWHAISRFWSVLLVGLVILACWLWFRGYIAGIRNESCKQCISDYTSIHPTMGAGSTTNIYNADDFKYVGLRGKLLWLKFSVGK